MLNIRYPNLYPILLAILSVNFVYADVLTIEDFDSYADTSSMQANVTTFGAAAQVGVPSLAIGSGIENTNAAHILLTWEYGSNANLSLTNLNPAAQKLSEGSSIQSSVYLETAVGHSAAASPTCVKLAIEGANATIWQTKPQFAVQPRPGAFYQLAFNVSSTDMENVSGTDETFAETIANVRSIRFRFENDVQAGVFEDAYIDSIVSVTNPENKPSTGTIIQLGIMNLPKLLRN